MDETWDLSFTDDAPKHFLMVFIVVKDPRIPERIINKLFKRLKKKNYNNNLWFFHATRERPETLQTFYEYAISDEISIITYYVDKAKLFWKITKDQHLLYNNIVCKLLKQCAENLIVKWPKVTFYAARKETNRYLNHQFITQVEDSCKKYFDIDVLLRYPRQEKWLQVVDWMAYALFRKYEFKDNRWYDKIRKMIRIEDEYQWYEK